MNVPYIYTAIYRYYRLIHKFLYLYRRTEYMRVSLALM